MRRWAARVSACFLAVFAGFIAWVPAGSAQSPLPPSAGAPKDAGGLLSGFAVISKVVSISPEFVFQADGYRIRIPSSADLTYSGDLKSLSEVGTNVWVHYAGRRDAQGQLVASRARFFAPKHIHTKEAQDGAGPASGLAGAAVSQDTYVPVTRNSIIDADGHLVSAHTKVRLSDAGGECGWHKVPADQPIQDRVRRIGLSLVPEFQKQLPADSPYKVHYRFYAVEESQLREDLICNVGLILVPIPVLKRLKSDVQLAAVLADGIADSLQRDGARLTLGQDLTLGLETAAHLAALTGPGPFLGGEAVSEALKREMASRVEQGRDRIALQLMADAGYDPWQSPEAWRLLAAKGHSPTNGALKYPRRSQYQLVFLRQQYSPYTPPAPQEPPRASAP